MAALATVAASSAVGVAVEKESDACPLLHDALHTLGLLALDEVEAAEKAAAELWEEAKRAKGAAGPEKPGRSARPG